MRKALFAFLAVAPIFIYPRSAHADTIVFSVSVIGSGSIGSDKFADQRVTFTASIPEQNLLDIFSEAGDNPSSFATCGIPTSSATIQGIGTFGGPSLTCVTHNFGGPDTFTIRDGNGGLTISRPIPFDSFQSSVGPVFGDVVVNFDFLRSRLTLPVPTGLRYKRWRPGRDFVHCEYGKLRASRHFLKSRAINICIARHRPPEHGLHIAPTEVTNITAPRLDAHLDFETYYSRKTNANS